MLCAGDRLDMSKRRARGHRDRLGATRPGDARGDAVRRSRRADGGHRDRLEVSDAGARDSITLAAPGRYSRRRPSAARP